MLAFFFLFSHLLYRSPSWRGAVRAETTCDAAAAVNERHLHFVDVDLALAFYQPPHFSGTFLSEGGNAASDPATLIRIIFLYSFVWGPNNQNACERKMCFQCWYYKALNAFYYHVGSQILSFFSAALAFVLHVETFFLTIVSRIGTGTDKMRISMRHPPFFILRNYWSLLDGRIIYCLNVSAINLMSQLVTHWVTTLNTNSYRVLIQIHTRQFQIAWLHVFDCGGETGVPGGKPRKQIVQSPHRQPCIVSLPRNQTCDLLLATVLTTEPPPLLKFWKIWLKTSATCILIYDINATLIYMGHFVTFFLLCSEALHWYLFTVNVCQTNWTLYLPPVRSFMFFAFVCFVCFL